MQPASQRLLGRPPFLHLLRCRTNFSIFEARQHIKIQCFSACNQRSRRQFTIRTVNVPGKGEQQVDESRAAKIKPASRSTRSPDFHFRNVESSSPGEVNALEPVDYGNWSKLIATRLHTESNLSDSSQFSRKLLYNKQNRRDGRLWARLLSYRQRLYGDVGVLEFWNGVRSRKFWIPCQGRYAEFCWVTFVKVAAKTDERLLKDVCEYANQMVESTGKRWSNLYSTIILHLLRNNQRRQAIECHELLISHHAPSSREFSRLCRQLIIWKGDLEGLRVIYLGNIHRNVYGKIVPPLCTHEDFHAALDWHTFLLRHQDLPADTDVVEPLLRFLLRYNPSKAAEVTRDLRLHDIPIGISVLEAQKDILPLTRETMNIIHGKTFNISEKTYNDDLGARWFATRWISVDLAINTIHSLGIREIGPLSLQAIALRGPDGSKICARIEQLKNLGIGLGTSLFSRALEMFAGKREQSLIDALLTSDQHPIEYDNRELQEKLLFSYDRVKNDQGYKLTLAMLQIDSKSPSAERENLMLRSAIANGHVPSILDGISKMQDEGVPICRRTLANLTRGILQPRRSGTLPATTVGKQLDLKRAIQVLISLMKTGSYVPPIAWREIIRRLGMTWPFHYLQRLCTFLASWYGGGATSVSFNSPSVAYHVPEQLARHHRLHPLRILFPDSLQQAIVEWGFIHAMASLPRAHGGTHPSHHLSNLQFTSGIFLLKTLQKKGVHINPSVITRAVYNRLVIYYGPGSSQRAYNRHARAKNPLTLEEMASQIDSALGQTVFTGIDLRQAIQIRAARRARKLQRKRERVVEKPASRRAGWYNMS